MSGMGSLSGAPSLAKPSASSSGGGLTGGLVPMESNKPKAAGSGRMADLDALLDMIDDDNAPKKGKLSASSGKAKVVSMAAHFFLLVTLPAHPSGPLCIFARAAPGRHLPHCR